MMARRCCAFLLHAALAVLVHVPRLTADEGFVNLDLAAQAAAGQFILHRQPDSVKQKPCGLLGDAKRPVEFPRGNAVPIAGNEPHGREPLV
jgi:hypothetical protein